MNKLNTSYFFLIIVLAIFIFAASISLCSFNVLAQTDENSLKVQAYVVDNANVFSQETKISLEEALKELEQKTNGVQIVVFTEYNIPEGMTLEERTLSIAESNGIGKKDQDNGLLFYLAKNDRQYRWEVGYGLEPVLSSAWLGRISREFIVPKFKEGDFEGGILLGLVEVEDKLINSADESVSYNATADEDANSTTDTYFSKLSSNKVFVIIFILVIFLIIKSASRKKKNMKEDKYYTGASSVLFSKNFFGKGGFGGNFGGGSSGGGFSGGGGHFGGGGFGGKF
ncbi:MAG: TPM domain-containing protein [Candidatus Nanoarchaeia archaeon]